MYPDTDSAAEMTEIMMTAWVHSRGTAPALPDGRDWPRYDPETPHLCGSTWGAVGASDDAPNRDELLSRVAVSDAVSELERCCWSGSY